MSSSTQAVYIYLQQLDMHLDYSLPSYNSHLRSKHFCLFDFAPTTSQVDKFYPQCRTLRDAVKTTAGEGQVQNETQEGVCSGMPGCVAEGAT